MSRAFQREGVQREIEAQLAENLWAISIDPNLALQEWLSKQLGGGAPVRLLARSSAFQYFVAAAPGAREMITIAKVFELAQLERWDRRHRTYDLVIVDAPASGHGLAMLSTPKHVRRDRARRPDQAQAEKIRRCSATPTAPRTWRSRWRRRCRSTRRSSSARSWRTRSASGSHAVVVNALYPERYTRDEAEMLRSAAGNGLEPEALDAVRAALAEHERASAQQGARGATARRGRSAGARAAAAV